MKAHSLTPNSLSFSPNNSQHSNSHSPPTPSQYIKFRTSHHENIRYLKSLQIIRPDTDPRSLPTPDSAAKILASLDFLKSRGFTDDDIPRLASLAPDLFSPSSTTAASAVDALLAFLQREVSASAEDSRRMIVRCPALLFSDVEYCLRPTLEYLKRIGLERLDSPANLNAYLLNTRAHNLERKVRFLRSLGMTEEEAERVCARVPAIFGYSIEENLRPKFEYLVWEMERSVDELIKFPQYFAFSLEKRIAPRHVHLKERNVKIPLNRMLLWSDHKFYAKWK